MLHKFTCLAAWAVLSLLFLSCTGNPSTGTLPQGVTDSPAAEVGPDTLPVATGAQVLLAERMDMLRGKRVALVANHTSLVNGTHLVDTLKAMGVQVAKVFAPEHGFRGDHDAGKKVSSTVDERTGIPLVSLYGSNKKPTPAQLADVDLVVFDIQDVGARFYTYISTLTYVLEACAENGKRLVVLDRPNPNGWYVDGPVLEKGLETFVGLHPVPIVHGMTVGEYAMMAMQEGWLKGKVKGELVVVPCKGYTHAMRWEQTGLPWVAPSPNLATEYSAYLYPILCWYEGMPVSVGRGTDAAFTLIGAPWHVGYENQIKKDSILGHPKPSTFEISGLQAEYVRFTPRSLPGKATQPLFEGRACYGARFTNRVAQGSPFLAGVGLLLNFQEEAEAVKLQEPLFQPFFDNLCGTRQLKLDVQAQKRAPDIIESWRTGITAYKAVRKRYLLYPDFE